MGGFLRFAAAFAAAVLVNAAIFLFMGGMNLGGREQARPLDNKAPRLFAVRKIREAPTPPRKTAAPAPAGRTEPREKAQRQETRAAAPRAGARIESRLTPVEAPFMAGISAPVPSELFRPDVFDAPPVIEDKPAVPRPSGNPVSSQELDDPPEVAVRVKPEYPTWAADRGVTGSVTLKFLVTAEGVPEDIVVLKWTGDEDFADAARKAVRQWRFKPGTRGGKPVSFWCRISVRFEK